MSIPRLAIFDFDGTLADSMAVGLNVYNDIASEFNLPMLDKEGFQKIRQLSLPEVVRYLGISRLKLPFFIMRGRQGMRQRVADIQPCNGIAELLENLEQTGIRFAVLTSNSRSIVEAFIQQHGLQTPCFIDSTRLFRDKGYFLRRRRRAYPNLLYVTDEARDVEITRKHGVKSIAVDWGFNSRERLIAANPNHVVSDQLELGRVIRSLLNEKCGSQ